MVAAFADIANVARNADNSFFKSTYADLGAVLDSVRPVYARHKLSVTQVPGPVVEVAGAPYITLTSVVMHESGQHLVFNSQIPLAPQTDKKSGDKSYTPQAAGSALTYLRRYALAAIAGVAQVDDDGNEASGRGSAAAVSSDDVAAQLEAAETYEEVCALKDAVQATGDESLVKAFVDKRMAKKPKKAKA